VSVEVVRAGLLSTVQDLGRPGLAGIGVPRSGAADPASLRLANRLVGNAEDTAGVETTLLGVDLRFRAARWVAVTGATCPVRVDGRAADADRPLYVPAGATLSIGTARYGVRSYLAIAGGIAVAPVLRSRSTDVLSGIGPPPLAAGTVLPLGEPHGPPSPVDTAPHPVMPALARLRIIAGPRDDRFTPAAARTLSTATYEVTTASNRIGVRLRGPGLAGRTDEGLPSEGVVLGAVQVPPTGQPVVFLADHPTTGGYPVIGVVDPDDMWMVAQAGPGTLIRFAGFSTGTY
jgi:biotin-dependent carboxylase-like uncharacterized protein